MAPVIAAVAKVVTAIIAKVTFAAVAKFIVTTALSIGISKLIAKRAMSGALAGGEGGGRVQLPPATDNKLPVVYGTAFIGGSIIDAMLSTDQKTMWYVVALAEHTDTTVGSGYSFGTIYYDGKQVNFGTNGAVASLQTNNAGTAQIDTRVNGYLYIYLFTNGSSSGTNTGGQTAAQILSVANGVPSGQEWDANDAMTNCAFAIVKVKYSTDAGTTGVGALTAQITNSIEKPGEAILDYMQNTRYGCAIPLARIDTASLTDLDTYSDVLIDYKPVGWSPGDPYSQQARYRVNGPLDTSQNCLENLQRLVDSCDSWLQYSELTGQWRVVINKLYDGYPDPSGLFLVDSSNLVGGIEISPIDLNETYNQIEVAYPNTNIKDQTDYQIIDLFTDYPSVLSYNEAVNRLNVTFPLVNNAVQAKYLAARRIFQSREDLVISFRTDFSGIQIEAGDVIRVTHEVYGWTDKLFRVNSVAEEKDPEGNLFAAIQAFEYNDTVYADDPVQDFVPAFNTGLLDPNVIDAPGAPVATNNPPNDGQVKSFNVSSSVSDNGLVLYMDFNYGNSSNVQDHVLYRTLQQSNGDPFTNSDSGNAIYNNVSININDLPAGNYYFSTTARNNKSGKRSNSSPVFNWVGANLNANSVPANTIIGAANVIILDANSNIGLANAINFIGTNVVANLSNNQTNVYISPSLLPGNSSRGFNFYGQASTGNYTFTDLTSSNVRDEPCYLYGTSVDANNYYPWYQNTSVTTAGSNGNNYYSSNSTAPWTPAGAADIIISDGDDNWYAISTTDFDPTNRLSANNRLITNIGMSVVSNVNATMQYAVGFKSNAATDFTVQTQVMGTFDLVANKPIQMNETFTTGGAGLSAISSTALFVRNITPNSNVIFYGCLLQAFNTFPL